MKSSSAIGQKNPPFQNGRVTKPELLSPATFSIAAIALVGAVFAVYSSSLNFQFVLDDHRFINDPRIQSAGHVWEYFTSYVWAQFTGGPSSFYRPLFVLWMRLNFIFNETSAWGWHFLSIAKHVSVAILLGLLVWELLHDRVAVLMAAALFAFHPAQTESVAWVSVPDPLTSAAVLAALFFYLKYAEPSPTTNTTGTPTSRRKSRKASRAVVADQSRLRWLVAAAACCLAAFFTKETAVVLLPAIFALALLTAGRASEHTRTGTSRSSAQNRFVYALRQTIPFLCLTVIYLVLRIHALGERLGALTQHLTWHTLILSWPATLWFYVKVLLWPVRSRAFADPTEIDAFSVRGVLLPALAVCCTTLILSVAVFWAWRKAEHDRSAREAIRIRCALVLGTLILVLPIILALNLNALNPGDFLHGRYTYLPLAGLMLLLATGWHLLEKQWALPLLAAALLAVAFAVLAVQQENEWQDDLTLFTAAHQIAPHNVPVALSLARAHVQVALDLGEKGRCDEALPVFDGVIHEYPQDWYAWAGRGECLIQLNDLPKAEESLRRAAALSHSSQVMQEWQEVRAKLAGSTLAPRE
jgi:hypothetical protein